MRFEQAMALMREGKMVQLKGMIVRMNLPEKRFEYDYCSTKNRLWEHWTPLTSEILSDDWKEYILE